MTDYPTLYRNLKRWAESQGWKVTEDTDGTLLDYAAMNPEAAKAMGYSSKPDVIEMSTKGESAEKKYKNLSHELIERRLMKSGLRYWDAHEFATKYEGNWDYTVAKSKPEQIASQLGLHFDGIQSGHGLIPDKFQYTDFITGSTTYGNTLAEVQYRLSRIRKGYARVGQKTGKGRKSHRGTVGTVVGVLR